MERIAMEAQAMLTTQLIETCKNKTISKKHNSAELTEAEKTAFMNCCQKYFETPNHIMSVMQQAGGPQGFWVIVIAN